MKDKYAILIKKQMSNYTTSDLSSLYLHMLMRWIDEIWFASLYHFQVGLHGHEH